MVEGRPTDPDAPWLALVVGNTRLHWAGFRAGQMQAVCHTPPLTAEQVNRLTQQGNVAQAWLTLFTQFADSDPFQPFLASCEASTPAMIELYCASVVPQQTALWQSYPNFHEVHLAELPLQNQYPTLGIDRALNLLGAGDRYGWPVLVIDAGTALTFTAGTSNGASHRLLGGAILPGLALQFQALSQATAALPQLPLPSELPPRWSTATVSAIQGGVVLGALATIRDFIAQWHRQKPSGRVVLTGGDGPDLFTWLTTEKTVSELSQDANLMFWGLHAYRQQQQAKRH